MSYILEALKKAQAERQLGSAPTIHAMPIQAAPAARAAVSRRTLWIVLGGAALVAGAAALAWWRPAPTAPTAPAVLAVQPLQAEMPVVVAVPPVVRAVPQSVQPVIVAQPVVIAPRSAPPPVAVAVAVAPPVPVPVVQAVPAPVPAKVPPPPAVEAPAPEENLPFMNQLPEPQRSELPKVVFGGYMYSKNPADRLLLIDKVLRREGEEVAPGLILEQLQSKAAVMNYRGTRYRVAY